MDMNKLVKLIIAELSNEELESYLSDSQKTHIASQWLSASGPSEKSIDEVLENYSLPDLLDNYSSADVLDFYDISDVIAHCLMGGYTSEMLDSMWVHMTSEEIAIDIENHFRHDPDTFKDLVKYLIDYL